MHYYVGKGHVIPMKWEQVEQLKTTTRGENPASKKANAGAYESVSDVSAPNLSSFFKNFGSNILTSGGGYSTKVEPFTLVREYPVQWARVTSDLGRIKDSRDKGWSYAQIAKQVGRSRRRLSFSGFRGPLGRREKAVLETRELMLMYFV